MRVILVRTGLIVCAVILGFGIYFIGCCKKGTDPQPPKDYRVYLADVDHPYTYFAFHPATGALDSFELPYRSDDGFAISPDGTIMYLLVDSAVVCVELDSFTMVEEHFLGITGRGMMGNSAIISPDGTYLAIFGEGLSIFSLPGFTMVYHDSNDSFNGVFSQNSCSFYCAAFDSQRILYAHKLALNRHFESTQKYFTDGAAWMIVPNETENAWFVFLAFYNDIFLFEVYDVLGDSATFEYGFAPGHGDMAVTPDGRYLAFSQRGRWISDIPPPCYFTLFDTRANEIYRQVNTCGFVNDSVPVYFPVGDLCITPDGRWLIGTRAIAGGEIFAFNLQIMAMDKYVFFGHNRELINLTCQSWP